jgi:hypothetical protein
MFTGKLVCLGALLCAAGSFAQSSISKPDDEPNASASALRDPVAYVYVSTTPAGSSVNEIAAYAAKANGRLTPVPGSPITADVTSVAVNGLYLFGSNANGVNVDSYAIESSGALTLVNQTDVAGFNSGDCGITGPLFLDHTGHTLYDMEYLGNSCANNQYASFHVATSTGALTNLGAGVYSSWLYQPASFIGDNKFAYSASCIGDTYWTIFGLKRSSSGLLSSINNFSAPLPTPRSGDFYCPSQIVSDPANRMAIALQPVTQDGFAPDGGPQIGSFTAAANGDLSTTNTSADMPESKVGTALSMSMAPSGKLLAVGGSGGLQIFHFRGSAPPTAATGLLTADEIDQMFWDHDNHLYAISTTRNRLFVFTITPSHHHQAPGSPYTLETPQSLAVRPRLCHRRNDERRSEGVRSAPVSPRPGDASFDEISPVLP